MTEDAAASGNCIHRLIYQLIVLISCKWTYCVSAGGIIELVLTKRRGRGVWRIEPAPVCFEMILPNRMWIFEPAGLYDTNPRFGWVSEDTQLGFNSSCSSSVYVFRSH